MLEIECCDGCLVHHDPELSLESKIGKCTCPCHTSKKWNLPKRIHQYIYDMENKAWIDTAVNNSKLEKLVQKSTTLT